MSNPVLQKAAALFATLSQPVFLLDRQGRCLVPRQPDTYILPAPLRESVLVSKSGYLFWTLPGFDTLTLATKDRPEGKDILILCAKLIQSYQEELGIEKSVGSALKRLLSGGLDEHELETLTQDHHIAQQQPRAALLVRFSKASSQFPPETWPEMMPLAQDDLLVPLDNRSLLLARNLSQDDQDDLAEYAMALMDTLQNELGIKAEIGIGESAESLRDLPRSYQQALKAIQIGGIFHPDAPIHDHAKLVLERFMMECAPDASAKYISLLFNKKTSRLFTDEMLETIRVFIKHDLNLTDAARDLYIHRNTLVYRLDKIQKVSGLDLRHFRDAMLFKLLNDLRRRDAQQ